MGTVPARRTVPLHAGFACCAAAALILAAAVGVFVWKPAWPARIHGLLWGVPRTVGPVEGGGGRTTSSGTAPSPLPALPGASDRVSVGTDPIARDRDFLLHWAGGVLEEGGVKPDHLTPLDAFSLSRFRLPGGGYVEVYTRVPRAVGEGEKNRETLSRIF